MEGGGKCFLVFFCLVSFVKALSCFMLSYIVPLFDLALHFTQHHIEDNKPELCNDC